MSETAFHFALTIHNILIKRHGYAKHALGHDEIQPVSDLPGDSWGGLGATLIDALDTMMIMGIVEEFKEARKVLETVDFSIDLQVSFFETTIRHLVCTEIEHLSL